MNELTLLISAGYGVMFERWHDGRVECTLTTPVGDVITAIGATPAEALIEASPLTTSDLMVGAFRQFWEDGYRHGGGDSARVDKLEAEAHVMAGVVEEIKERLEKLEAA